MVIADRIAVMFGGRLHQLAPPDAVYNRPATAMVAEFIGLTNFIEGKVAAADGDLLTLETALGPLRCRRRGDGRAGDADSSPCAPRRSSSRRRPRGDADLNRLRGVVRARAFLGNLMDYRVEIAPDVLLRVQGDPHAPFGVGDGVHVVFAPAVHLVGAGRARGRGDDAAAATGSRPASGGPRAPGSLLAPALAVVVVFFVLPYANLLLMSFFVPAKARPYDPVLTLGNYAAALGDTVPVVDPLAHLEARLPRPRSSPCSSAIPWPGTWPARAGG